MKTFVYALSTCFHCQRTKKFLDEQGVDYDFVDVDLTEGAEREKLIEEVSALTGDVKFPVVKCGDKFVVGFNEDKLKEILP